MTAAQTSHATANTIAQKNSSSYSSSSSSSNAAHLSLDDLLDLGTSELHALYEGAGVPKLGDLAGDLEGRMLASPFTGERVTAMLRAFARSSKFPWKGKSFAPPTKGGDARGDGINRVFSDRNKWFRFETFIGKSRAGDFDALQLDYDNEDNPPFIRIIKDEVRELHPGLWLGQAYVALRGKTTLALYFALADRAR